MVDRYPGNRIVFDIGDGDYLTFTLPTVGLYLGLRRLGRDVILLRYPGVGHGFYGPAAHDLSWRIQQFVDAHLLN